jgi:hypothetical protein
MSSDKAESLAFVKVHRAKSGFAKFDCVRQHCLEHRFKLAGRRADDTQYLRCCGLLLQRLVPLTGALVELPL